MEYKFDFLVIGTGIAGLTFALKVADYGQVAIVTKKEAMETSTNYAQGGIASVFDQYDSFDLHIRDTIEAGDGLCKPDVVEMVVKAGPERIRELMAWGVEFSKETTDQLHLDLGLEGGHSRKRIVHAGDFTGHEVEQVLVDRARNHEHITIFENHIAVDLITYSTRMKRGVVTAAHEDFCCGAYVLDTMTNEVHTFHAKITVLATGGAGKVYLYTSNPDIATGDGIAMAYRAGALVANLEFVQFHPTCLYHPEAKNFLISEAVRGEGGILIDSKGRAFMEDYDPRKDLACRDCVARAIDSELKKSGDECVFLDIRSRDPEFVRKRFPNIYQKCLSFGIDMTKEPIPVVPAAHYMCGGVVVDLDGKTAVQRLYALGETASTGLHGANRLASNSLLEALVYAHRAAHRAAEELKTMNAELCPNLPAWDPMGTTDSDEAIVVSHNWDEIRRFMWNYVGIVRSNKRLLRAQNRIEMIQKEIQQYYWDFKITSDLIELRNIAMVAELIIQGAILRKESRGLHYNIQYPQKDDKFWLKDTILRRPFVG
ncbi:MAG: L-aspartate oxidase [Deltaproteobacteria bacterium]|nr:L-aspartate oxidase [Deltaproteobacteria bacterium]MBW2020238.1 L-aspartate oxidase [Deltaproteobacteria bacterium]MBW2075023.1 L-aspartate oxidase [Deltaproteobacteria bacterium]